MSTYSTYQCRYCNFITLSCSLHYWFDMENYMALSICFPPFYRNNSHYILYHTYNKYISPFKRHYFITNFTSK